MAMIPTAPRACCRVDDNLVARPHDVPHETLHQCTVCGAKHYALDAPPLAFGVVGTPIAGEGVAPLTAAELHALRGHVAAAQQADAAKRAYVRELLTARGLDPAGLYDFLPTGEIRPHPKPH